MHESRFSRPDGLPKARSYNVTMSPRGAYREHNVLHNQAGRALHDTETQRRDASAYSSVAAGIQLARGMPD